MSYAYNAPAYSIQKLSPKVKLAIRAYVSGAVKTQIEAAAIAQITPQYFSQLLSSPVAKEYILEFDSKQEEKIIDTTVLLEKLSRDAVHVMANLMRHSANEQVVLKAAADLMDRGPQTSKIQKHQVESFTLSGKDAREIAAALVASSSLKDKFPSATQGDYIKIDDPRLTTGDDEDRSGILGGSTGAVRSGTLPGVPEVQVHEGDSPDGVPDRPA